MVWFRADQAEGEGQRGELGCSLQALFERCGFEGFPNALGSVIWIVSQGKFGVRDQVVGRSVAERRILRCMFCETWKLQNWGKLLGEEI